MNLALRELCVLAVFCGAAQRLAPDGSVRRVMNVLVTAERINAASSPPATPANALETTKESCLVRKRLIPIASAATSSSRTALNARP